MMLAKSLQSAAGNAAGEANYIESVFQTHLYTGNGSTQTITNGIDLAGEGGLVWCKDRTTADGHRLFNTAVGSSYWLSSNTTSGNTFETTALTSFNSNGFTLGSSSTANFNTDQYASWTFREQPKFFTCLTYTGNGVAGRAISHNLGSVPGCMFVKKTSAADAWAVYHRGVNSDTGNGLLVLNSTAAQNVNGRFWWGDNTSFIAPTSTQFTVSTDSQVNENGATYVAYLFAHDAGGFGLSGEDNVISCGSFTSNGSGLATVNLGYEPQWVLVKGSSAVTNWQIVDNMRGFVAGAGSASSKYLNANSSSAELDSPPYGLTSTGFEYNSAPSTTFIYIAIRRGPMKVPESGTEVFAPVARAGTSADATVSAGFPPDSLLVKNRGGSASSVDWSFNFFDKLRSPGYRLSTAFTNAEDTSVNFVTSFDQNGVTLPATGYTATNGSGYNYINYFFRRAPGFFDEVCYTGTGTSGRAIPHNLAAIPELIICKQRSTSSGTRNWIVYAQPLGSSKYLYINDTMAAGTVSNIWGTQTTTTFGVENFAEENDSGQTFVAYLFASCPGVQSIQSYVGDGTTGRTINCGFTGGARFVCIKATSTTGSWWTFDSARGIVTNNDPALQLNSTAAEVTSADAVDTAASGFIVNQEATCSLNASGVSYLVWAIA